MYTLVFDIGGTCIKYAVMDKEAGIYNRGEVETPLDSLEHFLDTIEEIYLPFKDIVDGIALSMPGNIDTESGQVYTPGALLYNANRNIKDAIHNRIQLPLSVENDGKSAALAEVWKGNLKECQDGVVMILGTGIGGGIIKDRKIHKGNHFFAGEFSYMMNNFENIEFKNAFALRGSTSALLQNVAMQKQIDPRTINGKLVFEWIAQGDEVAKDALQLVARQIAGEIYNLQCILDPEKFLIGGGISQQACLLTSIQEHLKMIYASIPFQVPQAVVETCKFFNDSNLIGALYHFYLQYPDGKL